MVTWIAQMCKWVCITKLITFWYQMKTKTDLVPEKALSHRGLVMHIYALVHWASIGSGNAFSPGPCHLCYAKPSPQPMPIFVDRPILQIPKCTCSISNNAPFRTEMYTCGCWCLGSLYFQTISNHDTCICIHSVRQYFNHLFHFNGGMT